MMIEEGRFCLTKSRLVSSKSVYPCTVKLFNQINERFAMTRNGGIEQTGDGEDEY